MIDEAPSGGAQYFNHEFAGQPSYPPFSISRRMSSSEMGFRR
jgi:hypothetical protein